jgi:hypothetical protein
MAHTIKKLRVRQPPRAFSLRPPRAVAKPPPAAASAAPAPFPQDSALEDAGQAHLILSDDDLSRRTAAPPRAGIQFYGNLSSQASRGTAASLQRIAAAAAAAAAARFTLVLILKFIMMCILILLLIRIPLLTRHSLCGCKIPAFLAHAAPLETCLKNCGFGRSGAVSPEQFRCLFENWP